MNGAGASATATYFFVSILPAPLNFSAMGGIA
jgi:hypothetical protein